MCFYLPWLLSLFFWILLLRALKNHEKNLHFVFENKEVKQKTKYGSLKTSGQSVRKSSIHSKRRANLKPKTLTERRKTATQRRNGDIQMVNRTMTNETSINYKLRNKKVNKITLTVILLTFTSLISR